MALRRNGGIRRAENHLLIQYGIVGLRVYFAALLKNGSPIWANVFNAGLATLTAAAIYLASLCGL